MPRDTALRALKAAGPPHSSMKLYISEDGNWVTISDGKGPAFLEYIPVSGLTRQTVNRLSRRYQIPRDWFYNSLLIPGEEHTRKAC